MKMSEQFKKVNKKRHRFRRYLIVYDLNRFNARRFLQYHFKETDMVKYI